jgi:hypothetical protein
MPGLLHLDGDVAHGGAVSIEYHNVGALRAFTPEGDGILDLNARRGIAERVDEASESWRVRSSGLDCTSFCRIRQVA